jgi:hypothetical protein
VALSSVVARTHPRHAGLGPQLAVLAVAVVAGLVLSVVLLLADRSSWSGARTTAAVVTGRSDKGVVAQTSQGAVVLHLARVPATGTRLQVEVAPDGRARPASYAQTPGRAARSGVVLLVLLTLLVQGYRWAVTARA